MRPVAPRLGNIYHSRCAYDSIRRYKERDKAQKKAGTEGRLTPPFFAAVFYRLQRVACFMRQNMVKSINGVQIKRQHKNHNKSRHAETAGKVPRRQSIQLNRRLK